MSIGHFFQCVRIIDWSFRILQRQINEFVTSWSLHVFMHESTWTWFEQLLELYLKYAWFGKSESLQPVCALELAISEVFWSWTVLSLACSWTDTTSLVSGVVFYIVCLILNNSWQEQNTHTSQFEDSAFVWYGPTGRSFEGGEPSNAVSFVGVDPREDDFKSSSGFVESLSSAWSLNFRSRLSRYKSKHYMISNNTESSRDYQAICYRLHLQSTCNTVAFQTSIWQSNERLIQERTH